MKGLRMTARQKKRALHLWQDEHIYILKVCRMFRVTERTLWRWKKQFDGTLESLENKSSRPHTPHPNSHKKEEIDNIVDIFNRYPNISYCEAYGLMRNNYAYKRSYGGFYNFILRNNIRPKKILEKHISKPYDTPGMLGTKWQMDVKYVPLECSLKGVRYYQYTMIDEATRERFLFPYNQFGAKITVDFVKRAISYFGYAPEIIQTDNGGEFTNIRVNKKKEPVKHILDTFLEGINIKHQLIRAYTPRHNGKVERSHRSDQESFYNNLKFTTYEELKQEMLKWNIRYNNRPHSSLRDREGKRVWWSPIQKRMDLLKLLEEQTSEDTVLKVRFIKENKTKSINYIYNI